MSPFRNSGLYLFLFDAAKLRAFYKYSKVYFPTCNCIFPNSNMETPLHALFNHFSFTSFIFILPKENKVVILS